MSNFSISFLVFTIFSAALAWSPFHYIADTYEVDGPHLIYITFLAILSLTAVGSLGYHSVYQNKMSSKWSFLSGLLFATSICLIAWSLIYWSDTFSGYDGLHKLYHILEEIFALFSVASLGYCAHILFDKMKKSFGFLLSLTMFAIITSSYHFSIDLWIYLHYKFDDLTTWHFLSFRMLQAVLLASAFGSFASCVYYQVFDENTKKKRYAFLLFAVSTGITAWIFNFVIPIDYYTTVYYFMIHHLPFGGLVYSQFIFEGVFLPVATVVSFGCFVYQLFDGLKKRYFVCVLCAG